MPTNTENSLFEIISDTDIKKFNQKEAREKSSCIQSILEKLTDDLKDDNALIKEIRMFYKDNKRHKYSDITLHLFNLQHAEQNGKIENIEQNIKKLMEKLKGDNDETIKNHLFKLQDHVLLEVARLHEFSSIKGEIKQTSKEVEESKEEIKQTSKEVEEGKKSYITILGIFSSIVLSFVAGLSFSNSILSNIDKASIYRLVFVMSFIALFVGNILYFLFAFLLKISSNIPLKTSWLFIGFNFIILTIMFINLICYLFNIQTIDDILGIIIGYN